MPVTKKQHRPPSPPPSTPSNDETAVLSGLEALREAFQHLVAERGPGSPGAHDQVTEDCLALFKVCQGLDLDRWQTLSTAYNLHEWFALPLTGDLQSVLVHIQHTLEHLAYLTDHDPLTGLANRRAFERGLDLEMERAGRSSTPMSLAIIDLDDFKGINDSYGHPCGDKVLVAVAETVERLKRRYDLAARIGGEEFAVILSGAGVSEAQTIIERLHRAVSELRVDCPDGDSISLTCSIGLAPYKGRAIVPAAELLAAADKALYQAKGEGKNRIVTAPVRDLVAAAPRDTLVHASEKKFLFTGS